MKKRSLFSCYFTMKTSLISLAIISFQLTLTGQTDNLTVTRTSFSSDRYDEFAPVYYKAGLVFCTNRNSGMTEYSNSQNKGLLKIFCVDSASNGKWQTPRLMSKELKTKLNDGPASFNHSGDTVYYSRNLITDERIKKMIPASNKLGIFYAVREGKKWTRIREMRFNSEWYNITSPCLSPDGKRLYFASDKPDGYGGSDIYYSQFKNGYWEDPVNLGPVINTKGSESYPFMNEAGELFFSSDGHQGLGGKDIFVTKQNGSGWYQPVGLSEPINSEADDFGFVSHSNMREGYFSSNRGTSFDIFRFSTDFLQVWFSEPQKENQYCINFSDSGSIQVDTNRVRYRWNLGGDHVRYGKMIRYCFPGPGRYEIALDLADRKSDVPFFRKMSYDIEIIDIVQPYIESPEYVIAGDSVEFNGIKSFCPGNIVAGYFWDFGDGIQGSGETVRHAYELTGEFNVRLGLKLRSETTGDFGKRAVVKKILVFETEQERSNYLSAHPAPEIAQTDLRKNQNVILNSWYTAETDYKKEALFQVEIRSSKTRIDLTNAYFRNVPSKYSVKEVFDDVTGLFSYTVDQQISLMATYQAYSDLIVSGYENTRVKIFVLKDPAEKELYVFERTYGLLTDSYFDMNNRLVTNAYLMLDQVVLLMNKYPGIILEIGVHTDNQGLPGSLLTLSQMRAQMIRDYLIDRGINSNRLMAKGYGVTRPLTSNTTYLDKRLNRRIDFTILLNQ